jgi:plasmid maintenance system antidote protein VapI
MGHMTMTAIEKIQKFLDVNGVSRDQFSAAEQIPRGTFQGLMTGETKSLSLELALKISAAMGTTVNYLMDESKDWPPTKAGIKEVRLTAEQEKVLTWTDELGFERVRARIFGLEPVVVAGQQFRYPTLDEAIKEEEKKDTGPRPASPNHSRRERGR